MWNAAERVQEEDKPVDVTIWRFFNNLAKTFPVDCRAEA